MYLHKDDRELLHDIVITVSERSGLEENIVEKDYYVTLILKELIKRRPDIVFKGGTSLSKAYHVIDRFSEDIDITFTEHIGESRRKKLKYHVMKAIGDELDMEIQNWQSIESDKDYNHYDFLYEATTSLTGNVLKPYVRVETALMSYAYPTEEREISNIIFEFLKDDNMDIIEKYDLIPFKMQVQSLTRTFIDKLFAVCDYYMNDKAVRNSRHLYDVYKLYPYIEFDDEFYNLLVEVRKSRSEMDIKITPSARYDINVLKLAEKMVKDQFYKKDYEDSTMKLISDEIRYEDVIERYMDLMTNLFRN